MATALKPANILLPKNEDMEKWAVIACDQFTSEPQYWEKADEIVGDAPSTLRMILPEVYLEETDEEERLAKIKESMQNYLAEDLFTEYKDAMIYVERIDSTGKMRAGIVGMIDLEEYNYEKGSTSQVRATEATVISRIPPRIKVRKNADIEMPHIMILIDDAQKTVVEPLAAKKDEMKKLYDFNLMLGGGKISGYLVDSSKQKEVNEALDQLNDLSYFNEKYGLSQEHVLLYAMGDGNHSLATAKEFYEQLKKNHPEKDLSDHPARYALVEIVNLHSEALEFEAIHRIVTEIDAKHLLKELKETTGFSEEKPAEGEAQKVSYVVDGAVVTGYMTKLTSKLTVGTLQNFLDHYLEENGGKIDYIHGTDTLIQLTKEAGTIGFLLPDMEKEELFPTVICDGALPRKTFSMGHAQDKRYYVECRKIVK